MYRSFDDETEIFFPTDDGKLFHDTGTVVFPSRDAQLNIENKATKVCIFLEKRRASNIVLIKDGAIVPLPEVNNYIFAYLFKGADQKSGARCVFSFLDEAKSTMSDDYKYQEARYNKLLCQIDHLKNHQFVYLGGRNEG